MHNYKNTRMRFHQSYHRSEIGGGEKSDCDIATTYPRTADYAHFRAFHRTYSLFYSEHVDNMTLNK